MRGKNQESKDKEKEKAALQARKAAEQKKKDEVAALFTPIETIQQAKVPFGVGTSMGGCVVVVVWERRTHATETTGNADPKTILCAFFKAGKCQKGTHVLRGRLGKGFCFR